MSDFTQAVCVEDWNRLNPDKPVRPEQPVDAGPDEVCCYCGQPTRSGIYVRVDPDTVPHATRGRA